MLRLAAFSFLIVAVGTQGAAAATIVHETFSFSQQSQARAELDGYAVTGAVVREETFEAGTVDTTTNTFVSLTVGTFTGLGGTGSGGSNIALSDQIKVREETNLFGRQNLTPNGSRFLDSNDTLGWSWTIDAATLGLASFTDVAFLLMDAGDQGATFALTSGADTLKSITGRSNGAIDFIALSFDVPTTLATLTFANTVRLNDGFGIDQVRVYGEVAPVPVPPAMLLLGSGLLALGIVRRRRRAAA